MKHLLKFLPENAARPIASCVQPIACWAALALIGMTGLACSDPPSAVKPTVATMQAAPGAEAAQPVTASGDEGKAEAGDMPTASATPSISEEALQPELIAAGGAGEMPAMMNAAESAASAGTGGAGGADNTQATAGSGGAAQDGWVPLFNGTDLDGWMAHGTNQTVFVVENGEIHVYPTQLDQSDQPQANLRNLTRLSGKYTLHVEYKWGVARFGDRKQADRDAGILFHITGDVTKVWPDSIECQIGGSQLGGPYVAGDVWVLGNPTFAQFADQNGQRRTAGGGYGMAAARAHAENAYGEWNTIEITVDGAAEAVYSVNGVEVNHVFDMTHDGQPLSEGFISVQAEYAELFYRNIRYKLNE
jgi:hypothetical protein